MNRSSRLMPVREILEKHILRDPAFGFPRCAIMASAGTGKTYQLAMRYIRLLLHGAAPDEIAAVTFSKKAAAEIFEKIVSILLNLIESQKERENAAAHDFLPAGTGAEELAEALRKLLSSRRRLHIETNDSFLMQIVQGAPSEFGIRGEIRILDENDDDPRRRALLETLHSPAYAGAGEEAGANRRTLYQILKDCSYGKEKASLYGAVTELLKERFPNYLAAPFLENWDVPGISEALSKRLGRNDLEQMDEAYHKALSQNADEAGFPQALYLKFDGLWLDAAAVPAENPRRPESGFASFFLENGIFDCGPHFEVHYNRKTYAISSGLADMIRILILHLLAAECKAVSEKSKAVFRLMQTFESSFNARTREAGLLTFADVIYIVNRWKNYDFGSMQVILERLGTHITHYLLDEFQDTSTEQWNAFEQIVGEILASDDASRFSSFFMVGDIKQSIYQWRKGNPALFKKICRDYDFFPPPGARTEEGAVLPALALPEDLSKTAVFETPDDGDFLFHGLLRSLTRSFRSCTPVLQAVNDVFSADRKIVFPARLAESGPMFCRQREKMDFREHFSELGWNPGSGFAVLYETPKADQKNFPSLLAALLRKLKPFDRPKPLSVAVLFRWNKNIAECCEVLRRTAPEIPVSMEGKITLKQSMTWAVFRQILRLAAHPGDPLAGTYLAMLEDMSSGGGLQSLKERLYPSCPEPFPLLLRREAENAGCAALFRRFRRVCPFVNAEEDAVRLIEDSLTQLSCNELPSLDKTIEVLDHVAGHLTSADRTVQLMTIHQSKGLGFDIVILADEPLIHEKPVVFAADETTSSYFFTPRSSWHGNLPRVREILEEQKEKECYEKCCNLYVAMTRAKRGLYMFITEEKGNAKTLGQADILRAALVREPLSASGEAAEDAASFAGPFSLKVLYSRGNPHWFEESGPEGGRRFPPPSEQEADREKAFRMSLPPNPFRNPVAAHTVAVPYNPPSLHAGFDTPALRFAARPAADFGTEIHRILSQAEWLENPSDVKAFLARTAPGPDAAVFLERTLNYLQIIECFRHPDISKVDLWREKPFLIRRDAGFVNGIMDRVVIEYGENGSPVRAAVMDFKTDRLTASEDFLARYKAQLEEYRFAVSSLTGLPMRDISCVLLALHPGRAIRW